MPLRIVLGGRVGLEIQKAALDLDFGGLYKINRIFRIVMVNFSDRFWLLKKVRYE